MATTKKADLMAMINRSRDAQPTDIAPARVEKFSSLVGRVGAAVSTDLGFVQRLKLRREIGNKTLEVERHKLDVGTRLTKEWIDGEAELIRTDWKRSFNDRYSAIAEAANASEYQVRMRLEGLLSASRTMVFQQMHEDMSVIKNMLDAGVIDQEDAREAVTEIDERYRGLRREFAQLCDRYKQNATAPFAN